MVPAVAAVPASAESSSARQFVVVVGAGGNQDYQSQFNTWADRWQAVAASIPGAQYSEIGRDQRKDVSDKDLLHNKFAEISELNSEAIWIVLIGHGTFDREAAKFNLRGPDVSALEIAQWADKLQSPLIVINCASASGPFINRLSGKGRAVITATKSGQEQNFARFGDFLSQAISDIGTDLDHDDEVSLLEAFLSASDRVAKFYESESRLATEHALIDDNGDGLGTPAALFRGTEPVEAAKEGAGLDGLNSSRLRIFRSEQAAVLSAQQIQTRTQIEAEIDKLKKLKAQQPAEQYYSELEALMLRMAELYKAADRS